MIRDQSCRASVLPACQFPPVRGRMLLLLCFALQSARRGGRHFPVLWKKESPEHWKFMVDPELKKIGVNFSFGSSDDTNFLV